METTGIMRVICYIGMVHRPRTAPLEPDIPQATSSHNLKLSLFQNVQANSVESLCRSVWPRQSCVCLKWPAHPRVDRKDMFTQRSRAVESKRIQTQTSKSSGDQRTSFLNSHSCKLMINKPPPFQGLNIRIPIIIPMKGRGLLISI